MERFSKDPNVYEIGGVKVGGQPGDYPTVCCFSIFQESDKLFDKGSRRKGFNEQRATELLKKTENMWKETGVPAMADIVASPGEKIQQICRFCDLSIRSAVLRGRNYDEGQIGGCRLLC